MKFYIRCLFAAFLLCACSQLHPTSPTETLKEFVEASKSKDLAKIKATASKKTIQLMEETVTEPGITLQEAIQKNESVLPLALQNLQTRNERINGDRATVEVKSHSGDNWLEFSFVMEEGRWKVAAGEMFYEGMEKFNKSVE